VPECLIDSIDSAILDSLRADARMSVAALAAEHHISRATAYARLNRLRETGVIQRFTIVVDPEKVGFTVSALILIVTTTERPFDWDVAEAVLRELPEVQFSGELAGEYDAFILARFRDTEHMREFIRRLTAGLRGVGRTRSMILLNEGQERLAVLPTHATAAPAEP
jgi:DNA-binding Lrp family transcriptional regulator